MEENKKSKVYKGGLPEDGVKLFPAESMEEETKVTFGGEFKMKAKAGGPATSDGFRTHDFLDDSSYRAGDMEVGRDSSVKIVNPDDLSH